MNQLKKIINEAQGFLICTGAGMSSDSGIAIYNRQTNDITNQYTNKEKTNEISRYKEETNYNQNIQWGPYQKELDDRYPGLTVDDLHDFGKGDLFSQKGLLLWKYLFDQRKLFLNQEPHPGYSLLNEIIRNREYYTVTSNIDSYHLRSGMKSERVVECHGSLLNQYGQFRIQCSLGSLCNREVWNFNFPDEIRESSQLTQDDLPRCCYCDSIARPNYLTFNDDFCLVNIFTFDSPSREKMITWLDEMQKTEKPIVIFEIGVGDSVLTIRNRSRKTWRELTNSFIIRINPSPDKNPLSERYYNIPMGCQEAMSLLQDLLME